MELFAPNFPLDMACTELLNPLIILNLCFMMLVTVEVICEGAFFCLASRDKCWYENGILRIKLVNVFAFPLCTWHVKNCVNPLMHDTHKEFPFTPQTAGVM